MSTCSEVGDLIKDPRTGNIYLIIFDLVSMTKRIVCIDSRNVSNIGDVYNDSEDMLNYNPNGRELLFNLKDKHTNKGR